VLDFGTHASKQMDETCKQGSQFKKLVFQDAPQGGAFSG
jgi:hypothetical protein